MIFLLMKNVLRNISLQTWIQDSGFIAPPPSRREEERDRDAQTDTHTERERERERERFLDILLQYDKIF